MTAIGHWSVNDKKLEFIWLHTLTKSCHLARWVPVIADGQQGKHAGGDGHVGHEVVDLAIKTPVDPNPISHEDEGGYAIDGGDEEVWDS